MKKHLIMSLVIRDLTVGPFKFNSGRLVLDEDQAAGVMDLIAATQPALLQSITNFGEYDPQSPDGVLAENREEASDDESEDKPADPAPETAKPVDSTLPAGSAAGAVKQVMGGIGQAASAVNPATSTTSGQAQKV